MNKQKTDFKNLNILQSNYKTLAPFYFEKLGSQYLLTNDGGDHCFLTKADFSKFLQGKLPKDKDPFLTLHEKNFLNCGPSLINLSGKYRAKHSFLFTGPSLHIVVVTLRCNHKCLYCHASSQDMSRKELDMSLETARKVLDTIFKTTSLFIAIEFQGGEPLVNWPVVKFIVEEAWKRNKVAKKDLELRLVSNFTLMTEEKFKYLIDKKVSLCLSLDGPEKLHNKNRPMQGGTSYKYAAKWANRFFKEYPKLNKKGYIFKMGLAVTISRFSLPYYKAIIDEFLKLGFDYFYLRPLNPFGFTLEHWKEIGYTAGEYINFYKKALDYIIKLNLKRKIVREKMAVTFLIKILTEWDPGHMDFRSPCGAGLGQLAYNYNGDVYTCDEGRMLSMMGDENFRLGSVYQNDYKEIIANPVVRTMSVASCLDGLAGCSDCVFKPYCGVCPIYNYSKQGNIFGQMPVNERCMISKAILNYLFEKLKNKKIREVFKSWVDN